jgi:hypothetical protein
MRAAFRRYVPPALLATWFVAAAYTMMALAGLSALPRASMSAPAVVIVAAK